MNPLEHLHPCLLTRRQMLRQVGTGLGFLGLAGVLGDARLLADDTVAVARSPENPLAPRPPHFPARAKRVIHIYLNGGPSQGDTSDPKPALVKYAGQLLPSRNPPTERPLGAA
ncbi:MAG TPA: DUF1501 domain-containing protein, partial [Verrucomicrobiota bacterium]|nr:DUF1501 domain-containing protein [Verrucomicrobiota bacterium]